ncbi:MAG: hypothetical protein ISS79_09535 [Phycisphaerae bacterium]|nr:hypothetical protein [Phycisphaerae bacterium]
MKRTTCLLTLSVLIPVLAAPARSRTNLLEEMKPWLIAQPHPELSRISSLQVTVIPSGAIAETNSSLWKGLRTKVEQKLEQAGLKIPDPTDVNRPAIPFDTPQFNIHIDMLKLEDARQYVFGVRTSLARPVHLVLTDPNSQRFQPGPMLSADVWSRSAPMQVASSKHTLSKITQIVLGQTEAFTANWIAANPPDKKGPDAGDVAAIGPNNAASQPPDSQQAEYKYVASKNSTVFHLPGCSSAKRIAAKNRVGYKSRNEAINAGKRPCKLCKP